MLFQTPVPKSVALGLMILCGFLPPLAADNIPVTLTPDAVAIDAGLMGQFNMEMPVIAMKQDDYTGQKPAVTVTDATHATATYPCGAEMHITVTGEQFLYSFTNMPTDVYALRFNIIIPIKYNQGGKFSFDQAQPADFPKDKDKTFLHQGNGSKFTLIDSLGNGFSLTTPMGWQELADNRAFNWSVFRYTLTYGLNHLDKGILPFNIAALEPGKTAGKFLIDRYGQVASASYPDKVTSDQELKDDVGKDEAYLAGLKVPSELDSYGGLAGSLKKYQLKKTGFFHVETAGGRQTLVDPDGNMFYSLGTCTVQPNDDYTLVKGREKIYESVPLATGDFASAWMPAHEGVLSFYLVNWIRKYGQPFDREKWTDQNITRLKKWGFNTAGAFTEQAVAMQTRHYPITAMLPLEAMPPLTKMEGIDRMYDPFAPGTAEVIDKLFAEKIAPSADDPNIIGYYLGNEQLFENIPKLVPGQKSESPSKIRLVQLLNERYGGDIAKLNTAWAPAQAFQNFDQLKDTALFVTTPQAADDLREFSRLYLEEHYSTVGRIFRKYDSHHLLLGGRWQPGTSNNEMLVRIAAKYMDVISVNYYTYAIERDFLDRIENWSGKKPLLLSEWHFTCGDQGLSGDREMTSQKERGLAYRYYVENSAVLPYVVGQQWFSYLDQSATGRWFEGFNGEGANIGLINVVDRPYLDFVAQCKITNDDIYKIALGQKPPYQSADPRFSNKNGVGKKLIVIPRALAGLKLDGTTQNWPGMPPDALTPANLVQGTKDEDFRASFRLCYDDQNLYVIAEVKDKTPMLNPNPAASLYMGDCLEIFLGSEDIKEPGAPKLQDRQILIGASTDSKYYVNFAPTQPTGIKTLAVKSPAGDGYTIEAEMPWSSLGFKPKDGQEILFDLAVDGTSQTAKDVTLRESQWIWNGNARDSSDRSVWGTARFQAN